jgi:hypothetical protein
MTDAFEEVEAARRRCAVLTSILRKAKERALADPTGPYPMALGIIETGEKKEDAVKKVKRTFEELDGLLAYFTIIDLTASLEKVFSSRLGTAVGEARKIVREKFKIAPFNGVREALVHDVGDFQTLQGIANLLSSVLDEDLGKKLKSVQFERNKFAHGTDVTAAPVVSPNEAYEILKAIAEIAFS